MDDGVWVELAFTGEVSFEMAERFVCDVDDYAKRYGLRLGTGAAHDASERPWPGTAVMLDCAINRLAKLHGTTPQAIQSLLEEEASSTALT